MTIHPAPVVRVLLTVAVVLAHAPAARAGDFHFTLIGNSMLNQGVDVGAFSNAINHAVEVKLSGGARSLWKFCATWYVCKAAHRPKYVFIEFRGTELTDPMHNNVYGRDAMGEDPELHAIVAAVESDPPPQGNHDFPSALNRCYLPHLVRVARDNGVDLILARYKAPSYGIDENSPHDAYWDTVMAYTADLARYCQSNGVFLLDYQFAPDIKRPEHYVGPGDDHLNATGRAVWTGLLGVDVNALLAGTRGAHERTSFPRVPGDWEWRYGLSARDGLDEVADPDQDGMSLYAEFQADTDPTDRLSVLALAAAPLPDGQLRLTWRGGTGAVQHVEATTALAGAAAAWTSIRTLMPPTAATNVLIESTPGARQQLYRVRAQRP